MHLISMTWYIVRHFLHATWAFFFLIPLKWTTPTHFMFHANELHPPGVNFCIFRILHFALERTAERWFFLLQPSSVLGNRYLDTEGLVLPTNQASYMRLIKLTSGDDHFDQEMENRIQELKRQFSEVMHKSFYQSHLFIKVILSSKSEWASFLW